MESSRFNCTRPDLHCEACRTAAAACDCRWCVFNRYFKQANNHADQGTV